MEVTRTRQHSRSCPQSVCQPASGCIHLYIVPVPKTSSITCLNDYRPVALTSIIMTPHLFHPSICIPSTDDAIALTVRTALSHLDKGNTSVRMLCIHSTLMCLLSLFSSSGAWCLTLCKWILDFLMDIPQVVWIGCLALSVLTLSTGAPQGCVLSPLLYTLYMYDCIDTRRQRHPYFLRTTPPSWVSSPTMIRPPTERRSS